MYPLYYYLTGYRVLAVDAAHAAALLELCRREEWVYDAFRHLPDGGISLTFPRPVARLVEESAASEGWPLTVLRSGGVPESLGRLIRRPGLLVGCVLGLCLYIAGTQVVWDIRISGNHSISNRSVEETLAKAGITVGTSLRDFRADVVENTALILDDRLSWISINRRGTVAYVELREASHTPKPESDAPADLVASAGGIIQRIELDEGNVRVAEGQSVSPGDVLVSGIYDSQTEGIRFTRARARIYARTVRELTVTVPLMYEQKSYIGTQGASSVGVCYEKNINFFKKSVNFSKNSGKMSGMYDIIEEEQSLGPIEGVGFPISVRTVWYLPYEMITATRTHAEAEELAYLELARKIAALPGGAELLSKTITVTRTPDALILHCVLNCVEDIGQIREIQIAEPSPQTQIKENP